MPWKKLSKVAVALATLAVGLAAQPANTILLERWDGVSGTTVGSLTGNANYPHNPTTRTYPAIYEIPTSPTSDNYGTRTRGYVTAPTTGNYIFWIASDDESELWLGTNDQPSTIVRIAHVVGYTNSREWTKSTTQQSTARALTAGVRYYIETRHKEGTGGENLAVGWQLPSGVQERPIPGTRLSPFLLVTPPAITTQPANQTVTLGQTAAFSVVATGTAPLSYQWSRGGTSISGATSASYTTPATVAGDNGAQFSVVVTNTAGTMTSVNATLTVNSPPSITTQPANQTVTAGQTATFSVVASGTAPLNYQWRGDGNNISGATSASYTKPPTVIGDNGAQYSVVVANTAGNLTSVNATLTVNPAPTLPTITTQPAHQTVFVGQTASFSVVASGTAPLNYQWRKAGVDIPGATSASYTTPATVIGDSSKLFSVLVSNPAGNVTSASAVLVVRSNPTVPAITVQPGNATVSESQTAQFSVAASGTAPLTYQWRKGASVIAGATSASYTTPAVTSADNAAEFWVVVTNGHGSVNSSVAILNVNFDAEIIQHPASATAQPGQTLQICVDFMANPAVNITWRKNGIAISGANSACYTTPPLTLADNGAQYSAALANSMGTTFSNPATVTVAQSVFYADTLKALKVIVGRGPDVVSTIDSNSVVTGKLSLTGNPDTEEDENGHFPFVGWSVWNQFHYLRGLEMARGFQLDEFYYYYTCRFDPSVIAMQRRRTGDGAFMEDSMALSADRITFWGDYQEVPQKSATLDRDGLHVGTTGGSHTWVTAHGLITTDVMARTVSAEDVVITPQWQIPDYVFDDKYRVRSLDETEAYVKKHKHLPDIPSAKDIAERGMSQGQMSVGLLKTVEEMTLHMISLKKELEAQKRETARLRQEMRDGKAGNVRGTK